MVLSDVDIKREMEQGGLKIDPLYPGAMQPASVDLHLFDEVKIPIASFDQKIYPFPPYPAPQIEMFTFPIGKGASYGLRQYQSILASTEERIEIPLHLMGRLNGKSSLGRIWLIVHCTAGDVDPGFRGQLTLEISNLSPYVIALTPGMPIAQISFMYMASLPSKPYGDLSWRSHYQGQTGPTPAWSLFKELKL